MRHLLEEGENHHGNRLGPKELQISEEGHLHTIGKLSFSPRCFIIYNKDRSLNVKLDKQLNLYFTLHSRSPLEESNRRSPREEKRDSALDKLFGKKGRNSYEDESENNLGKTVKKPWQSPGMGIR